MPELPEVESVRLGLVTHTVGRTIVRAESRGARVTLHSPEGLGAVVGAKIGAVARRGKSLWFDLGESALVAHPASSRRVMARAPGFSHCIIVIIMGNP